MTTSLDRSWRQDMAAKRSWKNALPEFGEPTVREQVQGIRSEAKRAKALLQERTYVGTLEKVELARHWRTGFRELTVEAYKIASRSGGNKRTITFYLYPGNGKIIQIGNYPMGSPYWTPDTQLQRLPWGCNGTRRTVILQGLEEFCSRVGRSSKRNP